MRPFNLAHGAARLQQPSTITKATDSFRHTGSKGASCPSSKPGHFSIKWFVGSTAPTARNLQRAKSVDGVRGISRGSNERDVVRPGVARLP
jgi:hypothetical protein